MSKERQSTSQLQNLCRERGEVRRKTIVQRVRRVILSSYYGIILCTSTTYYVPWFSNFSSALIWDLGVSMSTREKLNQHSSLV